MVVGWLLLCLLEFGLGLGLLVGLRVCGLCFVGFAFGGFGFDCCLLGGCGTLFQGVWWCWVWCVTCVCNLVGGLYDLRSTDCAVCWLFAMTFFWVLFVSVRFVCFGACCFIVWLCCVRICRLDLLGSCWIIVLAGGFGFEVGFAGVFWCGLVGCLLVCTFCLIWVWVGNDLVVDDG